MKDYLIDKIFIKKSLKSDLKQYPLFSYQIKITIQLVVK